MIGWDDKPLLMPMQIVAMAVGGEKQNGKIIAKVPDARMFQWTDTSPDLGKLDTGFAFGAALVGDPTQPADNETPPGIHLHFRLPAAFTRGTDRGGKLSFAPFPNRWLIQRIALPDGATPTHRAWLLRSDRDDPDGIAWIDQMPTTDKPLRIARIGQLEELEDSLPSTKEAAVRMLTAAGQGDPLFAAFYPACRSVLGFQDPATDLRENGRVIYLVTGFFSSAALDPLAGRSAEGLALGGTGDASSHGRLLCHGATTLDWKGFDTDYMREVASAQQDSGGPFKQTASEFETAHAVALGDTAGEALSALLVNSATTKGAEADATELVQAVLSALQEGITEEPGTTEAMRIDVHARRFDPVAGGTVHKIERVPEPDHQTSASGAPQQATPLPPPLREALGALDDLQKRCDRLDREIAARRRQIHALWCRRMARLTTNRSDPVSADKYRTYIEKVLIPRLQDEKKALADARLKKRDALLEKRAKPEDGPTIPELLQRYFKTDADGRPRVTDGKPLAVYEHREAAAPPFFASSEPSVAIFGPAFARRNDGTGARDLFCRGTDDLIRPAPEDGKTPEAAVDAFLATVFGSVPKTVDRLQRALLAEILLLDDGARADATLGTAPHRLATTRQNGNPWTPLQIAWRIGWEPDVSAKENERISETLVSECWDLELDGEFRRRADAPEPAASRRVTGYGIAAASVADNLDARLAKLNDSHPLRDTLRSGRIGTQRLVGLHAGLRLMQLAPRIPPLDLVRRRVHGDDVFHLDPIAGVLDMEHARYTHEPDPVTPEFQPIRSGRMTLERLHVIDCFGQTMKLPVDRIASGDETERQLHGNENCTDRAGGAPALMFKPRLVQPARLRFEMLEGGLQGWLLLNHLDQSLTLYNAKGRPRALFQHPLTADQGTTEAGFFPADMPRTDSGGEDAGSAVAQLGAWLKGLGMDESRYFLHLLSEAISAASARVPDQDPIGALVGRPFALVRARVSIELDGLPVSRPAVPPEPTALPDSHGVERVDWPLRLGDARVPTDGLVGLFLCDETGTLQADTVGIRGGQSSAAVRFHVPWATEAPPGHAAFGNQNDSADLTVNAARTRDLLLVMDPQARVHATTGVLPRDSLLLPAELAGAGRRVREVAFQTGPVLGPGGQPVMPKPSADYGEWNWAFRPDVTVRTGPEDYAMRQADLVEADVRAGGLERAQGLSEGWLRLAIDIRIRRFEAVRQGEQVRLSWSVSGAETVAIVFDPDTVREHVTRDPQPLPMETESFTVPASGPVVIRLCATSDGTTISRDVMVR